MSRQVRAQIKGDARGFSAVWRLDPHDVGEVASLDLRYGDVVTLRADTAIRLELRPKARSVPTPVVAVVTRYEPKPEEKDTAA